MSKEEEKEVKINQIIDQDITTEMESAYLDYAMSVITSRALPDARDGLKPVQRRILYAMHGMGLRPSVKTRKSAAITGEVLGKYHPHGNVAVYEAMAKLTQVFTTRYPLVIGQGNFGSIDGDSPAAERYTEAKLSKYADSMLEDIEKETVNFRPNYENTLKEPEVLPCLSPNLLLNGSLGIAVGMATEIPPHNLIEVVNAIIHVLDNKDATTEDLMKYIKGPDFPLGGIVYDSAALSQAYATGRGRVIVRGLCEIIEEKKGVSIIITSLPYRVNKATMIEKIGTLAREKKIEGIKDLRDESTNDIRVVMELKPSAQPQRIQNILYKNTQLESSYNYNMVALIEGIPQTVNLSTLISVYIGHKREVIERKTKFELARAKAREHILIGLKKALDHIDEIIKLIKASKEVSEARTKLIQKFKLSEIQATAILEMKLQKLSGLETKKIENELKEVKDLISKLETILNSKKKIDAEIVKGLEKLKAQFGDERRTKVNKAAIGAIEEEDLIPEKASVVMITGGGYIKRTSHDEYKAQKRGGIGTKGAELKLEDFTTISTSASTHDNLLFFTNKGKIYQLKTYEIPEGKRTTKGRALVNFISIDQDERVTSIVPLEKGLNGTTYLFFVTGKGIIKKIALKHFANIRKSGIIALSLDKGDSLVSTFLLDNKDSVFIVTKNGKSIRFKGGDIRPLGRTAKGVKGIKLGKDDYVVKALNIKEEKDVKPLILTLSEKGYGKQTEASAFRLQNRGGSGIKAAEVTEKTGGLVSAHLITDQEGEIMTMSKKGQVVRTEIKSIGKRGRQTQGVSVMRLRNDDTITSVTHL